MPRSQGARGLTDQHLDSARHLAAQTFVSISITSIPFGNGNRTCLVLLEAYKGKWADPLSPGPLLMTLFSRKADYALLILSYLFRRPEGGNARAIAEQYGLSRAFVANI